MKSASQPSLSPRPPRPPRPSRPALLQFTAGVAGGHAAVTAGDIVCLCLSPACSGPKTFYSPSPSPQSGRGGAWRGVAWRGAAWRGGISRAADHSENNNTIIISHWFPTGCDPTQSTVRIDDRRQTPRARDSPPPPQSIIVLLTLLFTPCISLSSSIMSATHFALHPSPSLPSFRSRHVAKATLMPLRRRCSHLS